MMGTQHSEKSVATVLSVDTAGFQDAEIHCFWVYHERQQTNFCGMPAINNLLQRQAFTPEDLRKIEEDLKTEDRSLLEDPAPLAGGSQRRRGTCTTDGNFN